MDKREDAGEFYPGGKVISTRPVATGGDVKHSDFAGIEPLPERFTDEDVKTRLDQLIIAAKGGVAAVVALLLGAAALAAGVTVQTAPKGTIYNDEHIVTNVVFDATGLAEATNVYTKAETEAKIVELAPAPGDYATVSNAAMRAAAATNDFLRLSGGITHISYLQPYDIGLSITDDAEVSKFDLNVGPEEGQSYIVNYHVLGRGGWPGFYTHTNYFPCASGTFALDGDVAAAAAAATNYTDSATNGLLRTETDPTIGLTNGTIYVKGSTITPLTDYTESDPNVPEWAKAQSKPTYTASEVGATTPADVTAAIREQSLGGIWDAELEVWWTPRMRNGSLTYEATTNVNLNAGN